ncbi:hypothetical protein FRC00_005575, partial [Tulasnella sp. 408]
FGKRSIGPLDLLGGSAKHLRHVDLYCIPVRWRTGLFAQLNVLKLVQMSLGEFKLTTTHLLEILRASPDLEHLELGEMDGLIDHPPSSPVITHTRLRCINIYHCGHSFAGAILRRIEAPSCTKFYIDEALADGEEEHSTFLNEDLQNFKKILLAIHLHNGSSKITLDGEVFGWKSLAKNFAEHLPKSNVWLCCSSLIPCIGWVEDILQDNPGVNVRLKFNSTITQEVLQSIKPMQCVTRLEIVRSLWNDDWSLLVMKFIGEPLSTDPSSPPLPCLQEIFLNSAEWFSQSLLDMVRSRFNPSLWENTERTPLTIKISRKASSTKRLPRLMFDLTTIMKIRETDGVECVQFVGSEELDGTLAVTWDEED